MSYQLTRENRPLLGGFPLANKLVLLFALLCAILAALGGVFFFSLRSIEALNRAERTSALREIGILYRVGKNLGLRQAEVLRQVAATNPEERERHEQIIARLVEMNSKDLRDYEKNGNTEGEKRLYAELVQARKAYFDETAQLLALSSAQRTAEAATFALTTQVPTYDRYRSSLDALLRVEEAQGSDIAAATTGRIKQARGSADILIGLAIVIALGTGAAVLRMVRRLREDKDSLQTEVDEHQRAEQALREGEARYRLLVDHSPDAIFVVCDEKIVFANPATLKLLGADRAGQLIGLSPSDIVHPDERVEVALRSKEVREGKQPPVTERCLLRLDGTAVEVESRVISFLYEGKPALQVIAQDKTERKTAAQKLDTQENQYRLLFEDNPTPMWVYDVQSLSILAVNQAAIAGYGYSREEFLSRTLRDLYPSEDVASLVKSIGDVSAPASHGGECRHVKKDGTVITTAAYSSPTIFDNKQARMGTVFDITERRAVEKQLREAEEKYRSIFDNSLEGIFQNTPDGIIISANPALARMFGFASPEELIREHNSLEPQSYTNPTERQEFKRLIEEKGVVNNFEYEVKRKDGSAIWVSENVLIVRDAAGKALHYEGSVRDITERKQAEDRMRAILESALDCVITMDHQGRVVEFNPAAKKPFGYKRDGAIGQ